MAVITINERFYPFNRIFQQFFISSHMFLGGVAKVSEQGEPQCGIGIPQIMQLKLL